MEGNRENGAEKEKWDWVGGGLVWGPLVSAAKAEATNKTRIMRDFIVS